MRNITLGTATLVAAGGAAGSVMRYMIGASLPPASSTFPWATLIVNVAGSFVLGAVVGALPADHAGRLLFGIGLCGGFTTFSTFSVETFELLERGAYGSASMYVATSVVLSLLAASAGVSAGRALPVAR